MITLLGKFYVKVKIIKFNMTRFMDEFINTVIIIMHAEVPSPRAQEDRAMLALIPRASC